MDSISRLDGDRWKMFFNQEMKKMEIQNRFTGIVYRNQRESLGLSYRWFENFDPWKFGASCFIIKLILLRKTMI